MNLTNISIVSDRQDLSQQLCSLSLDSLGQIQWTVLSSLEAHSNSFSSNNPTELVLWDIHSESKLTLDSLTQWLQRWPEVPVISLTPLLSTEAMHTLWSTGIAEHCEIDASGHWLITLPHRIKRIVEDKRQQQELKQDVNTHIQSERELKQAKAEADRANQSKDQFFTVMSHEIRTPMNSIIGFADLLLDTVNDPSERDYLKIVKGNAYSLLEMINNVLNYSRLNAQKFVLKKQETDVAILIHEVIEALETEAKQKALVLEVEIPPELPTRAKADYLELRQVLLNLVDNAIKFTHSGSIKIILGGHPMLGKTNTDWLFQITVQDTGIGIPEHELENIFDTFEQVDSSSTRPYGGMGLGLAICKKIVELMGGKIQVNSELGSGTTFNFTFRAEPIQQPNTLPKSSSAFPKTTQFPIPLNHRARILIADDQPEYRELLKSLVTHMGYQCEAVDSGFSAIEALQRQSYDLIFMDIDMPKLGGLETTRLIRQGKAGSNNESLYICAVTAYTRGDERRKCLQAGMNEHIGKPFNRKKLQPVLDAAAQHLSAPANKRAS